MMYAHLHIQFDDDSLGAGEADELVQGDAGHGLPGDGGLEAHYPCLEGGDEEGGGDEAGPALVGDVVGHGVQRLHSVTRYSTFG